MRILLGLWCCTMRLNAALARCIAILDDNQNLVVGLDEMVLQSNVFLGLEALLTQNLGTLILLPRWANSHRR